MRPPAKLRRAACLGVAMLALASLSLSAQIIATATVAQPSASSNPHFGTFISGAKLGIALPSAPHLLLLWNAASLNFDRIQQSNGGSFESGLEAWVSPSAHPVQSHAPLLLAEAALGRRWGTGLHGYTALGLGAGWSFGDWVPYLEYRRRAGFHPEDVSSRGMDHEIVLGLHWVLFG